MSYHPWEKTIKNNRSDYKYAHNSIKNAIYAKKKVFVPNNDQVKFTIIGNRVTKEFVYCVHIAKILHNYRPKVFDAPIIRGRYLINLHIIIFLKIRYLRSFNNYFRYNPHKSSIQIIFL